MWLDAGYLGATEGYFFPHTFEITDRAAAARRRAPARGGGRLPAPARPHGQAHRHRRLLPLGQPRPGLEPGRALAPGARASRPDRCAWPACRCVCIEATEERGRLLLDVTLDAAGSGRREPAPLPARLHARLTGPDDGARARRRDHGTSRSPAATTTSRGRSTSTAPRAGGHGASASSRVATSRSSSRSAGEASDRRRLRTAFREVRSGGTGSSGSTASECSSMGSNQGPTRMALGEATPDELRTRRAARAGRQPRPAAAPRPRRRVPSCTTPPTTPGSSSGRTSRCSGVTHAGIRKPAVRQAREMVDLLGHHPSIVLWCAHNEPLAVDIAPGKPLTTRAKMRLGGVDAAPDVEQGRARPVDHAGAAPGRPEPRGRPALGRAPRPRQRRHRHATSTSAGTTASSTASRLRCARSRASPASSPSSAPRRSPTSADFMEPERWPDLDWDRLFEHHACQKRSSTGSCRPSSSRRSTRGATRPRRTRPRSFSCRSRTCAVSSTRPTGGFCHFCFADGHPAVTWSVLDHERGAKRGYAALRDACRSVLPMIEPRAGLVHVASERRHDLAGRGHRGDGRPAAGSVLDRRRRRRRGRPTSPTRRPRRRRQRRRSPSNTRARAGSRTATTPSCSLSVRDEAPGASVDQRGPDGTKRSRPRTSGRGADDADRLATDFGKPEPAPARNAGTPFFVQFYRSAIGKKWVMAVSGIVLLGYVFAHMVGNLTSSWAPSQIDELRRVAPRAARPAVPAHVRHCGCCASAMHRRASSLHIHAAYQLTRVELAVPGRQRYQSRRDYVGARTSRRARCAGPASSSRCSSCSTCSTSPGARRTPASCAATCTATWSRASSGCRWRSSYIVASIALGFHMFHGAWSLFQSVGWNNPRFNIWRRYFAVGLRRRRDGRLHQRADRRPGRRGELSE